MIVNLNIKHSWNFPENYCIKGFLEILTGKTVKKSMVKKVWKNNLMHTFRVASFGYFRDMLEFSI